MCGRNESWCAAVAFRTALRWNDYIVFLNHASTDNTRDIAESIQAEYPSRVFIIDEPDSCWQEMQQRDRALTMARKLNPTHISIVDFDELLTANLDTRPLIEALQPGEMLTLPLYNLRGSLWRYHANGIWGNRWVSVAWKDTGKEHWTGDQFHHREPWGQQWKQVKPIQQGQGGFLHLWGSSERRLKAKHALYAVTERIRWPHKPVASIAHMYGLAFENPQLWQFNKPPLTWWLRESADLIDLEQAPWQEAEVRRLIAEHGAAKFAGLNLHGLDK
jgi:hypothetical protein